MKLFLLSLLTACFFLLPVSVFAAPPYPIQVTSNNTTSIVVTISGLPADASTYELYNGSTAVGPNALVDTNSWIKSVTNGSVVWELAGRNIIPNSTYYFKVMKKAAINMGSASGITNGDTVVSETKVFQFGTPTTALISNFIIEPSSEKEAVATGKIDISNYSVSNLEIVLKWSATAAFSGTNEPGDRRQLVSGEGGQANIADDGTYTLKLTDLSPGSGYYFKQVLQTTTGIVLDTRVGTFDTDKGYAGTGTTKEAELLNSKTYHLLAPWPGLSELMDPDLCLQKKADKAIPQDAICDVNGFLNFAFKLLISITAVVLVLRLIFEGYQYIVTDIPFLKANAKSGFFESLLGLLLALSAYLILNTINPKLVNNTININSVDVAIDEDTDTDPITQDPTVSIPQGVVAACTDGIVKVQTTGGTFTSCKSISVNFKKMIDLAWSQGMKISGGGFRTKEQQIALRAAHCGGNSQFNVYEKSSSLCRPPTARPGRSNHESGLAFDLTCNGQTIRSRDNACFIWLQNNAKTYGLINFSKEPWHWSVNGK